ncbi:MAG: aminoglycoside phosphotransferase (APT) family kinase protein [Myxococcota bacterium]|jgi:aminoglycoside phosphotransferase (APT) family kinase protein
MSRPPWSTDHFWHPDRARAAIRDRFPAVACDTVEALGEGWDSQAFRVDGTWVFRFPKRDDVVPHLRQEIAVLPRLSLPIRKPEFAWIGEPGGDVPVPFVGYRQIPGTPLGELPLDALDVPAVLHNLLDALDAIHATPLTGPVAAVQGWAPGPPVVASLDEAGLSSEPLVQWAVTRLRDPGPERVLLHDDTGPEHVLMQDGAPIGLIDWGDLGVGDPARDLVGLLAWSGVEPLREALDRTGADPALLDRAIGRRVYYALGAWRDGLRFDRADMVQTSVGVLSRLREELGER